MITSHQFRYVTEIPSKRVGAFVPIFVLVVVDVASASLLMMMQCTVVPGIVRFSALESKQTAHKPATTELFLTT